MKTLTTMVLAAMCLAVSASAQSMKDKQTIHHMEVKHKALVQHKDSMARDKAMKRHLLLHHINHAEHEKMVGKDAKVKHDLEFAHLQRTRIKEEEARKLKLRNEHGHGPAHTNVIVHHHKHA